MDGFLVHVVPMGAEAGRYYRLCVRVHGEKLLCEKESRN